MQWSNFLVKEVIEKIILSGVPLGHFDTTKEEAIQTGDLGLGFFYYAMSRVMKPKNIVLIGSYRGFSLICFALGLAHNGEGIVHFIDSSLLDDFWKNDKRVKNHFSQFGVEKHVRYYNTSTKACLEKFSLFSSGVPFIDILFIDGDHSLTGVSFDYFEFGALVKGGGIICLHDSFVGGMGKTAWQVAEFLNTLHVDLYESLTIEVAQGLTIIKKLNNELINSEHIQKKAMIKKLLDILRERGSGNNHEQAQIKELQSLFCDLMKDITDFERILEIRYKFLTQSNKTMLDQIVRLKQENKRLQHLIKKPS